MLSDQMDPHPSDHVLLEDEEDFLGSSRQQQQQSKAQKKRSWRRLFGKGGSGNKRKENQYPEGTVEGTGSLPSFSQSSSSDSGDGSRSTPKLEPQQEKNVNVQRQHQPQPQRQQQQRDDIIESSHIKVTTNAIPVASPNEYSTYAQSVKTSRSAMMQHSNNSLMSPATTTVSAAKSAVTQQHRNHISPRQLAASPTNRSVSVNSRSVSHNSHSHSHSRRTAHNSNHSRSSLAKVRQTKRSSSNGGADARTNKILSRPFGREHILTTEQKVR